MEERWKIQDMTREVKRKKMRGEFTGPTDVSTELFVKMVIKHQAREEKWKKEDLERIRKRIEYRKKHPRKEVDDRRWIALTQGTSLTQGHIALTQGHIALTQGHNDIRCASEPRPAARLVIERSKSLARGTTF